MSSPKSALPSPPVTGYESRSLIGLIRVYRRQATEAQCICVKLRAENSLQSEIEQARYVIPFVVWVLALGAPARFIICCVRLSQAIVEFDLGLARLNVIPEALAQAVKPIEKISDIRIFDTGGMLGRGGAGGVGGGGIGLGDGLAGQLLSVSALKPMIDKILAEAGFPAGPNALASLTSILGATHSAAPAASSIEDDVTSAVKEIKGNPASS
jgi:hypothetical protein